VTALGKKTARLICSSGEVIGVQTPYDRDFITAAQTAGYRFVRRDTSWRIDDRALVDEEPQTPNEGFRRRAEPMEALIVLVRRFFELTPCT
jgi:hypothetical protein